MADNWKYIDVKIIVSFPNGVHRIAVKGEFSAILDEVAASELVNGKLRVECIDFYGDFAFIKWRPGKMKYDARYLIVRATQLKDSTT
jgi:hypothetical protein